MTTPRDALREKSAALFERKRAAIQHRRNIAQLQRSAAQQSSELDTLFARLEELDSGTQASNRSVQDKQGALASCRMEYNRHVMDYSVLERTSMELSDLVKQADYLSTLPASHQALESLESIAEVLRGNVSRESSGIAAATAQSVQNFTSSVKLCAADSEAIGVSQQLFHTRHLTQLQDELLAVVTPLLLGVSDGTADPEIKQNALEQVDTILGRWRDDMESIAGEGERCESAAAASFVQLEHEVEARTRELCASFAQAGPAQALASQILTTKLALATPASEEDIKAAFALAEKSNSQLSTELAVTDELEVAAQGVTDEVETDVDDETQGLMQVGVDSVVDDCQPVPPADSAPVLQSTPTARGTREFIELFCSWKSQPPADGVRDEALLQMLRTGDTMVKHGRRGNPKQRCLYFNDELTRLYVADNRDGVPSKKKNIWEVSAMKEVRKGYHTEVWTRSQRRKLGLDSSVCFSLIALDGRTVNLECSSTRQRERWVDAITLLLSLHSGRQASVAQLRHTLQQTQDL
eukprot:TRINITY_DN19135_c0_g1_i1.p1 TRINITY_DN19135_c0_g1~~TRINITY_DN19135_c0_g1_i1.p1  ORF type:complete len:525 (-),score=104.56 TRINITY_DN19135_c0_g1_i1:9-1583(-)